MAITSHQLSSFLSRREETNDAPGAWLPTTRGPLLQLQKKPLWHLLETEKTLCEASSDYRPILTSTDIVLTSPSPGHAYEVELTAGPLWLDSYRMGGPKEITRRGSHMLTMTLKLSLNHLRQESDPSKIEVSIGEETIETRAARDPGLVEQRNALSATFIDHFIPDSADSYQKTLHAHEVENDRLPQSAEDRTHVTVKSHNSESAFGSVKGQPSLHLESSLICTVQSVFSLIVMSWLDSVQ